MVTEVWPSENDVSATTGKGRAPSEENLRQWAKGLRPYLYLRYGDEVVQGPAAVIGGFEHTGDSGLTLYLANGSAWLDGFRLDKVSVSIGLTANKYNHIFLRLDKTTDKVTGATWQNNWTDSLGDFGTVPDDSILAYVFQTGPASITDQWDFRQYSSGIVAGYYVGDGTSPRNIDLAFIPKRVIVTKRTPVGLDPIIIGESESSMPPANGVGYGRAWIQSMDETDFAVVNTDDEYWRPAIINTPVLGFQVRGQTPPTRDMHAWITQSQAWDPGSVTVGSATLTQDFTITGVDKVLLADADFAVVGAPNVTFDGVFVKTVDSIKGVVVTASLSNSGGGAENPTSSTLTIRAYCHKFVTPPTLNDSGDEYDFIAFS